MPHQSSSIQSLWLKWLIVLLFCYAILEKGFAYLFLGELLIVLGVLILVLSNRLLVVISSPILLLWALFAFWGACRTVPFLSRYHFDAIRDAVLWGYGTIAVLIVAFLCETSQIVSALEAYRKFLRWYFLAVPVVLYIAIGAKDKLPAIPWSGAARVPVISARSSEVAVHLCGAALFTLMMPARRQTRPRMDVTLLPILRFMGFLAAFLMVLVNTRGGFLAFAVPVAIVSILRSRQAGWKVVVLSLVAVILVAGVLSTNLISIKIHGRTFSSDQVVHNLSSIGGHSTGGDNEGNKAFRLIWWTKIVNYTIFGPYRWTGKGFGINLAKSDSPPGVDTETATLRSPHNGSMTVLARMGVPGLTLWLAFNCAFAVGMLVAYRRAVSAGSTFWAGINLWIFCYWLAAVINMSFDVYIEGPEGGIWFWSIIGFGVAALRIQAYEARRLARARLNLTMSAAALV
jgi:hypothetical protein